MEQLTCTTTVREDTLLACITGNIDHHTAKAAREKIDSELVDCGAKKLVLDLSMVEFMDSAGLGLILGRYAKISAAGGTLTVRDPSDAIVRIIKMAGAEKYVSIEHTSKRTHNKMKGN